MWSWRLRQSILINEMPDRKHWIWQRISERWYENYKWRIAAPIRWRFLVLLRKQVLWDKPSLMTCMRQVLISPLVSLGMILWQKRRSKDGYRVIQRWYSQHHAVWRMILIWNWRWSHSPALRFKSMVSAMLLSLRRLSIRMTSCKRIWRVRSISRK